MRPAARTNPLAGGFVALVVASVALVGCSRDGEPESDAERFCGEAAANTALISDPPMADEAELTATLEFYRLMGQLAPAAIAPEWAVLVDTLETATTVVPGDPESMQRVAMASYAMERSAYAVKVWLERNCGVTIPIVTIAPQADEPVRLPSSSTPGSPDDAGSAPTTAAPGG